MSRKPSKSFFRMNGRYSLYLLQRYPCTLVISIRILEGISSFGHFFIIHVPFEGRFFPGKEFLFLSIFQAHCHELFPEESNASDVFAAISRLESIQLCQTNS